jgi:tryptophan-rich sensory protein
MSATAASLVLLPLLLGSWAGYATRAGGQSAWYLSLRKPSWNPPARVFGPVWTVLYIMMGLASWLAWRAGAGFVPMALYAVQLALNIAWSFLFFEARSLRWAALDIGALWVVLIATVAAFFRVDAWAGALMLPYAAWVTFATALTAALNARNCASAWC